MEALALEKQQYEQKVGIFEADDGTVPDRAALMEECHIGKDRVKQNQAKYRDNYTLAILKK